MSESKVPSATASIPREVLDVVGQISVRDLMKFQCQAELRILDEVVSVLSNYLPNEYCERAAADVARDISARIERLLDGLSK